MKIENGVTNFAVYEDATEYYGMAEVTLPEITQISEEVKGAGIAGTFDGTFVGHLEAMSLTLNFRSVTTDASALSADTIAADVAAAVKSFQKWQAEKMGRDVNPSQLIALLMQTGVKRVEVRSPVFAAVADNAVAQIGTVSVVNGGAERE